MGSGVDEGVDGTASAASPDAACQPGQREQADGRWQSDLLLLVIGREGWASYLTSLVTQSALGASAPPAASGPPRSEPAFLVRRLPITVPALSQHADAIHAAALAVLDVCAESATAVAVCWVLRAFRPALPLLLLRSCPCVGSTRALRALAAVGVTSVLGLDEPHERTEIMCLLERLACSESAPAFQDAGWQSSLIPDHFAGRPPVRVPDVLVPADAPTPRELEVLRLVAQGSADQEVADALSIAKRTVRFHLANLRSKLQVTSRTALVCRARDLGWLP